MDQQFVEYIVKSLVGNPDAVEVTRTIDEKGVLLELTVAPEDLGRVIGKRGSTAQSIRSLLRALGTKNDARYNLKIVDPSGGVRPATSDNTDDKDETTDSEDSSSHSSVVSKTRQELADLDDLDV
ncbi:KH domain-containing protein [Candidatus Saccharibacteria bacterium]|nr:KH domain-containing protein [Candidatus Saccharibacteria bacterium]MCB9817472.1 KH domain-containing protein [Candidatus Nomurabacteria bacterium]